MKDQPMARAIVSRIFTAIAVIAVLPAATGPAAAQSVDAFYRGKTVAMVIG